MKKKGFTLVELLAVIAILAILAILALPNIMSLFNQAKQNSFENELKEIFKTAEQEWMKDSMIETNNLIYARCKTENCPNQLSLSGREEIDYYIEVDKAGKIIKYFATDNSYQYEYNGEGLKIEEIGNSKQVANLQPKDILTLTCTAAKKNGKDVTNGAPIEGDNVGNDCSGNRVANTIPSNAKGLYKIMAEQAFLDNVNSTYVQNTNCGIKFNAISSDTNGKGVYEMASTKDDPYPIYYYRGAVTNNNVKFGNYCWKAVRTTNTGGVKLIYNGSPDSNGHCTNTTGTVTQIGNSTFNDNYKSPAYVGYMYGTKDGTKTGMPYTYSTKSLSTSDTYKFGTSVTYNEDTKKYTLTNAVDAIDNTHHYTCFSTSNICENEKKEVYYVYYKNSSYYYYISISEVDPGERELIEVVKDNMFSNHKDSKAKEEIEKWYGNNIDNKEEYKSKIEDTVYCNDRSISQQGGWSATGDMTSYLYFSGRTRRDAYTPSLACERELDRFTVSPSIGNGELKHPVGLLTTDEIMLAGGKGGSNNNTYYLYTNQAYWAGSPVIFNLGSAGVILVGSSGNLYSYYVTNTNGLRPIVSLSHTSSVTGGNGSANDPYTIG